MVFRYIPSWLFLVLLPTLAFAQTETAPLSTTRDQASYAFGLQIGRNLTKDGAELNAAAVLRGIQDILSNRTPALSEEKCQAAITAYGREVQARTEEKRRLAGARNRQAGMAFLAANKVKAGVTTLPSGLQYEVLEQGDGATPKATDTVTTHYRGTFLDGQVFDSSIERGEPMTRSVSQVIRGWTEALQRMKVGDKWRLFVPSELAYGATGFGELIGPHTVLIFEIELLGIE